MCYIWLNGSTRKISSKIWHRLLFCCWVSIWLQSSVWLTAARIGEWDVLKTWDLDLGYEVAVILLFENWKFENGKGEEWEENKLRPQLRSGNGFSWSGFSTLSRPSRSSSASPGHLTFLQRIMRNELHENIKRKYHRRSDVSKLFLCLQHQGGCQIRNHNLMTLCCDNDDLFSFLLLIVGVWVWRESESL